MASFRIKLGTQAESAEVNVNGRKMENVLELSIKQGPTGLSRVTITIPAEEIIVEGEGEVEILRRRA